MSPASGSGAKSGGRFNSCTEVTRQWAQARQIRLYYEERTGSTNDNAKAGASAESDDFCLYLTTHQTAGRGRGTNQWLDTGSGESLLSTWSMALATPAQAITAPRVGLALHDAAGKAWPSLDFALKAPNDLYLDGKKIAGLLLESVSMGNRHRLCVGLGFNVLNHPRGFSTAIHLNTALGRPVEEDEWHHFLDEWKMQLDQVIREIQKPTLRPHVREAIKTALNANPARPVQIIEVTPEGDLRHQNGVIKWTDI